MLSNRSPTTEAATVISAVKATQGRSAMLAPAIIAKIRPNTIAAMAPPASPSTVLLGLMRGASLCLPNLRPAK